MRPTRSSSAVRARPGDRPAEDGGHGGAGAAGPAGGPYGLAVALVRELAADPAVRPRGRVRRSGLAAAVRAARSYEEENPPPVTRWLHRR